MTTGRQTLNSIETAISEVQRSVQRIQNELKTANDKKAQLLRARMQAFRELAEFRIRSALYNDVIGEAGNVSRQVAAMLEARNQTIATLKNQMTGAKEERSRSMLAHEKLLLQIEKDEERLDGFAKRADKLLGKEAGYTEYSNRYEQLKSMCLKAEAKAEQAEQAMKEKGASYKSDALFMYLWKREYGSKDYFANTMGLIEYLDKKVADLINYYGAKANYTVLLQIPDKLNDYVERLQVQIKDMAVKLEEMRLDKITELADGDLTDKLRQLRGEEADLNGQIRKHDAAISDAMSQLNHFSEGKDYSFKKAVEVAAETLEHEDFSDLLYEARQTDDPEDDKVLVRLDNINKQSEQLESSIKSQKDDLERLFKRKEDLAGLSSDFRRKHYDDPGSEFSDNGNLNTMMGQLMTGAITAAHYWQQAQQYQRWKQRPADPFRQSSPLPPFGGEMEDIDTSFDDFDHDLEHGFGSDMDYSDDDFGDDDFRSGGGF